jgi:hypothetical protein
MTEFAKTEKAKITGYVTKFSALALILLAASPKAIF